MKTRAPFVTVCLLVLSLAAALTHDYYEHVPLNTTDAAAVSMSGNIMIFAGGSPDRADALFFNIAKKKWTVHKDVLSGAGRKPVVGVSTPDGAVALFAGGQGANRTNYRDVDVYTALTGKWTKLLLSAPRGFLAATSIKAPSSLNGSLILFGGGELGSAGSADSARVDVFWRKPDGDIVLLNSSDALSKPRKKLAAATAGKYVLFAGGYRSNEKNTTKRGYCDDVDIYDSELNTWSTARLSQPRQYIAGTSLGNKAVFAGGFCSPCQGQLNTSRSNAVDVFDATTGSWKSFQLTQRRSNLAMTSVAGRFALIGGGTSDVPSPLQIAAGGDTIYRSDVVDVYDSLTGTWGKVKLGTGRCCLGAAGSHNTAAFCGGSVGDACDVFTFDDIAAAMLV